MKIRPELNAGDVVRLSNKGKVYPRTFPKKSTMVVSNVSGDGVDSSSVITCRLETNGKYEVHNFYRSELWFTGKNVFNDKPTIK